MYIIPALDRQNLVNVRQGRAFRESATPLHIAQMRRAEFLLEHPIVVVKLYIALRYSGLIDSSCRELCPYKLHTLEMGIEPNPNQMNRSRTHILDRTEPN